MPTSAEQDELRYVAVVKSDAAAVSVPSRCCMVFFCSELVGGFMKKIFVTVSGGCAYVMEDTVPNGYAVEIIDFDNIDAGDSFPSPEALHYCLTRDLHDARAPLL